MEEQMEFEAFPKMARLRRDVIITEKIDGTNAQIHIEPIDPMSTVQSSFRIGTICDDAQQPVLAVMAGSRTRYCTPGKGDNQGWAAWVAEHAQELRSLGVGRHFGEWWGQGIQRGYGLSERRFSLFNVQRWTKGTPELIHNPNPKAAPRYTEVVPDCCGVVPVLYQGEFATPMIDWVLTELQRTGSKAAPGFMQAEGIITWHTHANVGFKTTLVGDEQHKWQLAPFV